MVVVTLNIWNLFRTSGEVLLIVAMADDCLMIFSPKTCPSLCAVKVSATPEIYIVQKTTSKHFIFLKTHCDSFSPHIKSLLELESTHFFVT